MNPPLRTEQPHPDHPGLDRYDTAALVEAFVADQALAALAVRAAAPQLAAAVDAAVPRLRAGGRIVTVGAGTSGRLGVLDSVELHPTFSWPRERAPALLAGGAGAMFVAVEGAEDDAAQGAADLAALQPQANDVVLLLAASGATPYALGAAEAASAAGALTVAIVNNPGAPLAAACELAVVLDTGPEVISGSTRLKAGTAQKIALNTFSSSVMVRLHKVYGNLMVDLRASNAKLVRRALRLTVRATGASEAAAQAALAACGSRVKTAIVMLRAGVEAAEAERRLEAAAGSVAQALGG
ncbi:MAG: N-acetylmuramic acid 6-phosphate etherase [Rubrivivax sp.]|jgi:N-acetylmuramic acid 6-phosphate etherase|nr:N-acetylmuramic acid 6-phosphate etherase [Betaproteobacteria bacterium]MBP6319283.1 N-acetylmuramic acid 6-phosphate etherase [Rubrivivax sp.]MBK7275894.1 N-acetylmuramic acid 6-phosphate etherase [Betaproteobacteria bacterium]MBK7460828.1 N-acetylmuramic acid 6-phosphate etherase [Betaproteobacteria bacterium]MBK7516758.1 N-acetylmuramic acid 6-phosphate etherase [Betaproteobacteria bacterium]